MTITITATTRDGETKTVTAQQGVSVMTPLSAEGLIEATCGGAASCGTCHIRIAADWMGKLNARTEDEGYMLEALEEVTEIGDDSRLACQIKLAPEHDGLIITIAPEA